MSQPKILIVDDKESVVELLAAILTRYDVAKASDGAQALARIEAEPFDLVLTDVRMPHLDGFALLDAVKARAHDTEVVVMTAFATVPDAVAAVKRGAYDYIGKPFDPDEVALVAARAVEHGRAKREGRLPAEPAEGDRRRPPLAVPFRQAVEAERDRASRSYLVALMREFRGCVTWAADHAGMERESLHRVLKQYGIRSEQFKPAPDVDGAPSRAR